MKTALISTTIYVPEVLRLYRELDKDAMFFITGDTKTPHDEVKKLMSEIGNAQYYSVEDQKKLGYKSSEVIGWKKIMRRNIALLEAIKWGADIIITIDDDNIPVNNDYFKDVKNILGNKFNGLMANSKEGWFNIGDFIEPKVYHRGFSYDHRNMDLGYSMQSANGAKVGVAAGLWYGDPDIDAMQRITNAPIVTKMSELTSNGIVVNKDCRTVFNSQNTAYLGELAPLMMVLVGVGRYDDIWASYIAGRVMREMDLHIHFGKPYVWQERNAHSLWQNLKDEVYGMEHTPQFCKDLDEMDLGTGSVLEKLNRIYDNFKKKDYFPDVVHELGRAWCDDLEKII